MSKHNNQKTSAPTSGRKAIRGAGATYRASVQKQSRASESITSPPGNGKATKIAGQGSGPVGGVVEQKNVSGYGSGHYQPNKG